jgi:arabinose-5-phosphate isomerase
MSMLDEIDRVFQLEIDTLTNVRNQLDQSYMKAAELLFQCPGKVIVTGMGKSGLIAQKIAATMVSTGTSAAYLHPGDGLHGDAGIIRDGDVVLALSKSGETEELLSLLLYVKKLGIAVITVTANPKSTLAKASDLVLFTPIDEEACPLDLAPTSSTTAALVVGDALAMTLMKKRGVTPEQFALWHPGGQLGRRLLLTVSDIMRSGADNPIVDSKTSVRDMLYEISSKLCGAVSIINDDGALIGLVTDYDVRKKLGEDGDIFSQPITGIMNSNPTFAYADDMAITALETMNNRSRPFMVLPVLDRDTEQVVGMIHLHDLVSKGL